MRVFHTSVSWWFLTGVIVIASLLKSLGLFLVFWPILIKLLFGWSPLIILFSSPPVPVPFLWRLNWLQQYKWYHRHLHVLQFFQFSSKVQVLTLFLFTFFQFYPRQPRQQSSQFGKYSFFLTLLGLVICLWICDPFVFQRSLCVSFSKTDSGLCIYFLFLW